MDPEGTTARIVIFSRDMDIVDRLLEYCSRYEFIPSVFVDIRELYSFLNRRRFSIALIDLGEAPHEAMALAWELRSTSVHAPLVALVNGDKLEKDDELYKNGFDGIIRKDATDEELRLLVDNFLKPGRLRQQTGEFLGRSNRPPEL
jgi:DNA-binding NtrC family response regulator